MTTIDWDEMLNTRRAGSYAIPDHLGDALEEVWVEYISDQLCGDFRIMGGPELNGRMCSGKRVRADLVLQPRQPWGGRNGSRRTPITLEVKRRFEVGEVTKALAQAADYAHATWEVSRLRRAGWADIPASGRMLSSIMWSDEAWHSSEQGRFWVDRIAGHLNVMVLSHNQWRGWQITMSGNRQWSQKEGMANTRFNAAVKEGSR